MVDNFAALDMQAKMLKSSLLLRLFSKLIYIIRKY